jgi:hypothetical protein
MKNEAQVCVDAAGGVITSFLVEGNLVEDVTFDADGHITAVTLDAAGEVVEFEPQDDDTAYFNSTGERLEDNHRFNQEYFGKFKGLDEDKIESANGLSQCCNIVAFHFLDNGKALVQGIEWVPNAPSGDPNWRFPKQKGKPRVNVFSGTGAESNRVEVFLNSVTKYVALSKLSRADVEAL